MLTEEEKQRNRKYYQEKMKKQGKKIWMMLAGLFLLIFFSKSLWGIIGVNIHYSDGERAVKIIKLSEKGFIWKTWEAEGVLSQGGFSTTYIWDFSVDNWDPDKENLVNDIKTAFENGQTVKIHYDQRAGSVPWRSGTDYFVKEVKFP